MSPFLDLGIAFCIDSAVSGLYFLIITHTNTINTTYKNSFANASSTVSIMNSVSIINSLSE